jgi:hypothetical protein
MYPELYTFCEIRKFCFTTPVMTKHKSVDRSECLQYDNCASYFITDNIKMTITETQSITR